MGRAYRRGSSVMETKGELDAHMSVWLAAQRNRKPLLFLVLVLALLGVWAYFEAPASIFRKSPSRASRSSSGPAICRRTSPRTGSRPTTAPASAM